MSVGQVLDSGERRDLKGLSEQYQGSQRPQRHRTSKHSVLWTSERSSLHATEHRRESNREGTDKGDYSGKGENRWRV